MNVIDTIPRLRVLLKSLSGTLGLVPTMGFLHDGHLSLIRQARTENDHVAVSIFVNPIQFGPREDFSGYPRDIARDLALLQNEEVTLVWTPKLEEVYPPGFQTKIELLNLASTLEGAHRPGHFSGVTTVVVKLLNIFTPDRLYLGQKDAQQAHVIRQLVTDLNYPLAIVVCPTLRDPDGLAMSSRNTKLTPSQRRAATVLYQALTTASVAFNSGERDGDVLRNIMSQIISAEPLAEEQYVSAADPNTLDELDHVNAQVLLSIAVRIGNVRLIDNLIVPTITA